MPPTNCPTAGMMISPTSDVTIFPKAAPMTTPTARSTTLPRIAKSRNSLMTRMGCASLHFEGMPKLEHRKNRLRCFLAFVADIAAGAMDRLLQSVAREQPESDRFTAGLHQFHQCIADSPIDVLVVCRFAS